MLLIDEHDAPILRNEGNARFKKILSFFRTYYGCALKGNESIKYAVITGVMQIAKESLFSDFNNLNVDNVLSGNYSEYFGFSEEESKKLLAYYGYESKYEQAKAYYDGYHFGNSLVFNPWSMLKFIDGKGVTKPYWIATGENSLFKKTFFPRKTPPSILSSTPSFSMVASIKASILRQTSHQKEASHQSPLFYYRLAM